MKNKFKKLTGFFFAAVMTLVALPIQTFASEWGVGDNVYAAMLGNYIGSDGGTYGDKYNYDYIYYKSDGSVGTATRYASTHAKLGVSKNGVTQQAICIEAGVSYSTGSSYVGKASSDDYMLMLPTKARRDLKIALLCGFNSTVTKSPVANTNLDDFSFATQTITFASYLVIEDDYQNYEKIKAVIEKHQLEIDMTQTLDSLYSQLYSRAYNTINFTSNCSKDQILLQMAAVYAYKDKDELSIVDFVKKK